jgi:hypothetical protein
VRVFFIVSTLLFRRLASADDPNGSGALGKTDQLKSILVRMADDDLTLLLFRVNFIVENRGDWVGKKRWPLPRSLHGVSFHWKRPYPHPIQTPDSCAVL